VADVIEIRGLKELQARMAKYPQKLEQELKRGMDASLLVLHEKVPPYPPPPADSTYRRTGTLGRSLGASLGGGKSGKPAIYETKKISSGYEGRFGTNVEYAPYVIGENTQARVHRGRWWTLKKVAQDASKKIMQVWNGIAENLAQFLEGNKL